MASMTRPCSRTSWRWGTTGPSRRCPRRSRPRVDYRGPAAAAGAERSVVGHGGGRALRPGGGRGHRSVRAGAGAGRPLPPGARPGLLAGARERAGAGGRRVAGARGGRMSPWETVAWIVARAGGFTAYVLLTLAVALGLALSLRRQAGRWPRPVTHDPHRHPTPLHPAFVAAHRPGGLPDPFL